MELTDGLLLLRNVDQDRTCGDGIDAGILHARQVPACQLHLPCE